MRAHWAKRGWLLALVWVASRTAMVLMITGALAYPQRQTVLYDVHLFHHWLVADFAHGSYPVNDPSWQYPPFAAVLIAIPRALVFAPYSAAFVALTLATDAFVTILLYRRTVSGRGPWTWVIGLALIGPTVYGRFDIAVTALAVAALCATGARTSGVLAGLATAAKIWPVTVLLGARRRVTVYTAAIVVALVLLAGLAFGNPFAFLTGQGGRGLQNESVAATPFALARVFSNRWRLEARYGSGELVGPGIEAAVVICLVASVLALGWLILWRRRVTWRPGLPADSAMSATLLFVATSRVLSPQYLIWLVGLAALCLGQRAPSQRAAGLLVLLACALTQLEFPVLADQVARADGPAVGVLAARNLVIVAATVSSVRALVRTYRVGSAAPVAAPNAGDWNN